MNLKERYHGNYRRDLNIQEKVGNGKHENNNDYTCGISEEECAHDNELIQLVITRKEKLSFSFLASRGKLYRRGNMRLYVLSEEGPDMQTYVGCIRREIV